MIAQFKPTPRRITIATALLLLALAGFTFTRAAEKKTPAQPKEKTKADSKQDKQKNDRVIKFLEEERQKIELEVTKKQADVNWLREELRITDPDPTGNSMALMPILEPESLRRLEAERIQATARYAELHTLYTKLASLSLEEFRKAVQTAAPDPQLGSLLEKLSDAEVKLASLISDFSDKNPELIRVREVIKVLEKGIRDRLDGILIGLKTRVVSEKAGLDALQEAVNTAKRANIENASNQRDYWKAKADLVSLKRVREWISLRLTQEKIDAAIPRTAEP